MKVKLSSILEYIGRKVNRNKVPIVQNSKIKCKNAQHNVHAHEPPIQRSTETENSMEYPIALGYLFLENPQWFSPF